MFTVFQSSRPFKRILTQRFFLGLLLVLGFAIRLVDLKDPPLDFHAARQLRMAIIARGLYYQLSPQADPAQRATAIAYGRSMGRFEPPVLESLVALAYKLSGGEHVWMARLFTSLFWFIGGIALFDLARRMTSALGAFVSLGFYLFLPFGIIASRSFQPDPGMVMWVILATYGFFRWTETQDWKWALLAGAAAGIAVLIKAVAGYLIVGLAIAAVLSTFDLRRAMKSGQVWVMIALVSLPALVYYVFILKSRSSDYFASWTIALLPMLLDPSFYARWLNRLQGLVGLTPLLLGITGVVISKSPGRALLLGLWIGYAVYGLSLPYLIVTHDYYSLQLVPILALSLAPVGNLVVEQVTRQNFFWRSVFVIVAAATLVYPVWTAIGVLRGQDYSQVPAFWDSVGQAIPQNGKTIAITQDYGYPLMYYGWKRASLWPIEGERNLALERGKVPLAFQTEFAERISGKDFFLITSLEQLNRQPALKETLFGHYPVFRKGDGYMIFDLRNPL